MAQNLSKVGACANVCPVRIATTNSSSYSVCATKRAGTSRSGTIAISIARASRSTSAGCQARSGASPPGKGRSCRKPISMLGAARRRSASSGGSTTAETPSGAPSVKRRLEVAGSNGSAVETTPLIRARMSAIGCASSMARAVGTTPLGVLRNNGSLRRRRSRPRPWLTADADRFKRSAARPTCRSSSTTSNRTRRFRSARDRSIWFSIFLKSYHWIQLTSRCDLRGRASRSVAAPFASTSRSIAMKVPQFLISLAAMSGVIYPTPLPGLGMEAQAHIPARRIWCCRRLLARSRSQAVVRQGCRVRSALSRPFPAAVRGGRARRVERVVSDGRGSIGAGAAARPVPAQCLPRHAADVCH